MAVDTAWFVGIFCSEKKNINLKILIGDIAYDEYYVKIKIYPLGYTSHCFSVTNALSYLV